MISGITLYVRLQKISGNDNSVYYTAAIVDSNGERPNKNCRYHSDHSKEDAMGKLFLNECISFHGQDSIKIIKEGF
jgi:hypothetical protein